MPPLDCVECAMGGKRGSSPAGALLAKSARGEPFAPHLEGEGHSFNSHKASYGLVMPGQR